jgi:hypothetical protein
MLFGVQPAVTPHGRRRGEPVDELVQANRSEAARRRSDEYLPASEAH